MKDCKEKDSSFYDGLRKKEWKNLSSVAPGSKTRYRLIIRLMKKINPSGTLLDIGCGSGVFLHKVKQVFPSLELCGCDFSDVALEQTKEKTNIELFIQDIASPDLNTDKIFNIVICSEVLEHVGDLSLAVKNLNKLLNNYGHLILTVPFLQKNWTPHDDFSGHVRRFEPGVLDKLLELNGFRVVESFGWGNVFYEYYYRLLGKREPSAVMSNSSNYFKRIISEILYQIFKLDDLFKRIDRGRRLFIVAKKEPIE